MKTFLKSSLLAVLLCGGGQAVAQDKPSDTVAERPKPISRHPIKVAPSDVRRPASGPALVNRPELVRSDELKQLIERFQAARQNYLTQQKELTAQLGEASKEQRDNLREQLRENLEQWRDMQNEFRSQLKERAQELRDRLSSELGRVVDGAKEEGGGTRPRN